MDLTERASCSPSPSQNNANEETLESSEGENGERFDNETHNSRLLDWIKDNKLSFIKEILLQQEISLAEICALSRNQRMQFVESLQIENPIFEKRLLNAVVNLNNNQSTVEQYNEYIEDSIKDINDCMQVLNIQMINNQNRIKQIYDKVIEKANKYKDIALNTTYQIYDTKFTILNAKLQRFKQMQQQIMEFKDNPSSHSSDILSFEDEDNSGNIMDMIQSSDIIQINIANENIDAYIKNILHVNNDNNTISPPNIHINNTDYDCISIRIYHELNHSDFKITKYEVKYCAAVASVDIEHGEYSTQIIYCNETKLKGLKPATSYVLSARLYSSVLCKWSAFCKYIYVKTNDKKIRYDGRVVLISKNASAAYMNCIVHCLSHTKDLRNYFISLQYIKDMNRCKKSTNTNLCNIFANILMNIWSNRYKKMSHSLAELLSNHDFHGDPFTFLVFLLETFHSELKTQSNSIMALFQLQYKTDVTCLQCKTHCVKYEMYPHLSLPVDAMHKSFIIDIFHRGTFDDDNIHKPVRHIFHCDSHGIIKDLAKIVAKKYRVKRQFVLFYECRNMTIIREYEHKMSLQNVPHQVPICCYILKNWNKEITAEQVKVKRITLWLARLTQRDAYGSLVGMPLLLSFISIHTKKDIYKHVYERLYLWFGRKYLAKPPIISTKQSAKQIENEMKTYDDEWYDILHRRLPFKLLLDAKEIAIDDAIFEHKFVHKHIEIVIEWKNNNIYQRIKKLLNKVHHHHEYIKWKTQQQSLSIYDLFDALTAKKRISSEHTDYHCARCRKNEKYATKMDFVTFSKYLVIHLQRKQDDNRFVQCPEKGLNVSKYKKQYALDIDQKKENEDENSEGHENKPAVYDLYAVVSSVADKYECCIKQTHCDMEQWYRYTENAITVVQEANVISSSTKIVFYKKC